MTPSRDTIIKVALASYSLATTFVIYKLIVFIYQNNLPL